MQPDIKARPRSAIIFAWLIEGCAVVLGLANAYMTSLDRANLPLYKTLMIAAPFAMIAVAELSRIPLIQLFFYTRSVIIQAGCLFAVIATGFLTVENFAFGIERLVTLRAEDVTQARKVLTQAEENVERLRLLQGQAADSFQNRRTGLEASVKSRDAEIDRLNAQIAKIGEERARKEEQHTQRCAVAKHQCASGPFIKAMDDEARLQRAPLEAELIKQRSESERIRTELNMLIGDETAANSRNLVEDREAQNAVAKAKQGVSQVVDDSQMHRFAAMFYGVRPQDVTDSQFGTVRAFFSLLSAIIISIMGSMLAIGYHSEGRDLSYRFRLREARLHLINAQSKFYRGRRALLARQRKHLVREVEKIVEVPVDREVEKIVEITREVPVEHVVEKTVEVVKEVPVDRIVEKEVLKEVLVERIVEKPIEIIKEVPVDRVVIQTVEKIVEVPVEHQKLVEVVKEVPVNVEKVVKEVVEKPVVHIKEMIKYVPENWRGAVETKNPMDAPAVIDLKRASA